MSFIRPEVAAGLYRWREVLVMGVVVLLGAFWVITGYGLMRIVGTVCAIIGLGLLWPAFQKARFQAGRGGLGVVDVDERQVIYFAPFGGGSISLDAVSRIEIGPDRAGLGVWRLIGLGDSLTIPTSAEGTETLFDALASLPGADTETAIKASQTPPDETHVIWQRQSQMLH